MKEKIIEEMIKQICKDIPSDNKDAIEKVKEHLAFAINNETKDLTEEESIYLLNKFKQSLEQATLGYSMDNIKPKDMDMLSRTNNFIITIDDDKKMYSLKELLEKCNVKQLNLYHQFYSYMFDIYKIEKINDKETLINLVNQDIIFSFKGYVRKAQNKEIKLLKNFLEKKGVMDNINDDFIPSGFFIPFKTPERKKIKYIMATELLDIIKNYDFSVTSEETKELVTNILQYFIFSKGIVTIGEIEKFIIASSDLNIKKEELLELVNNKCIKKDDYYYLDKTIDNKQFNKLIKAKEEIQYIPSYEEIIYFENMIKELYKLLIEISNKEVDIRDIIKTIFFKPTNLDTLVNKICRKLKIKEANVELLEEFIYNNAYSFPYWIYNGEQEEVDDDIFDFFNFDDFDIDFGDINTDKEDLPF